MRDHRFAHAHASDYLDGELGPAERRRVERHTSVCPKCRQALESLRRTLTALRGLRSERRDDVAAGVIDRLRRAP
ncbi:MAG: zf-HC2 domain-containing protein [Thermoleophilaceae bacterium]|nr:zf-HC2 domain-containing protein [Thermoleophilaceae bacterium]